jgi:hypothetical protein
MIALIWLQRHCRSAGGSGCIARQRTEFNTTLPAADIRRLVLVSCPDDQRNIPLSGWMHKEERLARKAAPVAVT